MGILAYCYSPASVCTWMGDCISMSILLIDSPSNETLNRGPLALFLRRQYEFPFGINTMEFSIFQSFKVGVCVLCRLIVFYIFCKFTEFLLGSIYGDKCS